MEPPQRQHHYPQYGLGLLQEINNNEVGSSKVTVESSNVAENSKKEMNANAANILLLLHSKLLEKN